MGRSQIGVDLHGNMGTVKAMNLTEVKKSNNPHTRSNPYPEKADKTLFHAQKDK